MSKVSVFGLGYIGLPTAAVLANHGHSVVGVDINSSIVELINSGQTHIDEPDLKELITSVVSSGNLIASTDPQDCDIFIICVPTPFVTNGDSRDPDLTYVYSAIDRLVSYIKSGTMIVIESTIPVGSCDDIIDYLKSKGVNTDEIHLAYCPERVLPGNILHEIYNNDRIVGGIDGNSAELVKQFYESFVDGKVITTDAKTAEMCKLAENSFRDVNIAFANELSMLCDNFNIDVHKLLELANLHPRVNILTPGIGVGGHCISVDPWFIISADPIRSKLIATARKVNLAKTDWVIEQINSEIYDMVHLSGEKLRIACLGLAFKPNVDDLRESPAIKIVENLLQTEHDVVAVEPHIKTHDTIPLTTIETALETADLCIILVAHNVFLDIRKSLNEKNVLDYCGLMDM